MGTFVEGMKKNYFISAILTIALGAVLVIWPDWSGRILCYLLGAALILMGGIQLIVCIRAERIGFYSKFSMLMNIILILLGVWVCIRPDTVLSLVPVIIGIVMLIHGCMDLQFTMDIKHAGSGKWWIALIFALVTLTLGVFLVMHPFLAFEITMLIIGIGLLYDGISDLVLMIVARMHNISQIKGYGSFANAESGIQK
ncbi:MAG: HdeD family acid-resistance protein [Lachnospiraceae bacterium]